MLNEVEIRKAHEELKVGDGVTVNLYSDSHAYTVIKRTPATITIQQDKATLDPSFKPIFVEGGFAGHCVNQSEQKYSYERDYHGSVLTLRFSKNSADLHTSINQLPLEDTSFTIIISNL